MSSTTESAQSARHLHPVDHQGVEYRRRFTEPGQDPFETVEWGTRDIAVGSFRQDGVEAPLTWTDQSVGIVAKLYFATVDGVRENSVRQMIERVVATITDQMETHGYFGEPMVYEDRLTFCAELAYALLHQYFTFNSPVWFNLGVPGREPYCSACYLLATEDKMVGEDSITDWWRKEALIFKSGAGSGINLSTIRGSMEPLSTGGVASGPVAYMRPADAGAGTLKSGGAHRRAAKFVRLDDDHPDIFDFVTTKQREDLRMRALSDAGFDLDPTTTEGETLIAECTSFQNANISVGIHDSFMDLATSPETEEQDPHPAHGKWQLKARKTGELVEWVDASDLLDLISEAAWQCGDPGVQFHDTINEWHTTPSLGPITTSNPCGETLLNDDSSCNIGSLNVAKFLARDGTFLVDDFCYHVDLLITAMDATCSFSKLPTESITQNTRDLRQLGMGYANLGAALMVLGLPYDSDEGRDFAASVTALMTGRAYRRSAHLAEHLGAFKHFEENCEAMRRVIGKHIDRLPSDIQIHRDKLELWYRADVEWRLALGAGSEHGYRNSQVTLVAPTGTTSFMMGCDTTGIEPAFSLLSHKSLAGGGSMKMINGSVRRALKRLGYSAADIAVINGRVLDGGSVFGAPLQGKHEAVFQAAVGENPISPRGHIDMVAAVQPFLSQGISKTVNMPEWSTPDDVRSVYVEAWKRGLKSISIYRDNSKATQVLRSTPKATSEAEIPPVVQFGDTTLNAQQLDQFPVESGLESPQPPHPQRHRMPRERMARVIKFSISGHEGYLTVGMRDDGTLGEIFLNGIGKDGSTLRGMMDAWATDFSIALQYGVPLETLVSKHAHVNFPPSGPTGDAAVPMATSIVDYIARKLASMFLDADICESLGVLSPEVKQRMSARLDQEDSGATTYVSPALTNASDALSSPWGKLAMAVVDTVASPAPDMGAACQQCGDIMQRTGTCWACPSCGATTGCG